MAGERHLRSNVPENLKNYRRGKKFFRDEDPYHPYDGVEDTPRNRLLMFIAKWSPESLAFEAGKRQKTAPPKELLDDRCLVKWETSDPENVQGSVVLRIARDLVRIAHNGATPTVLDPFAGGGAIPLEAGRLGCLVRPRRVDAGQAHAAVGVNEGGNVVTEIELFQVSRTLGEKPSR